MSRRNVSQLKWSANYIVVLFSAESVSHLSVQYLIYLMFFQDNHLWRYPGNPGNGWWVIPENSISQIRLKNISLHLLPSAHPCCLVSLQCTPLYLSPCLTRGHQLRSLACFPNQPPLRCAQPSLVLQWFLGGEEIVIMVFHVIHLHVPGPFCPQELLSFREQHAKESE